MVRRSASGRVGRPGASEARGGGPPVQEQEAPRHGSLVVPKSRHPQTVTVHARLGNCGPRARAGRASARGRGRLGGKLFDDA